MSTTIEKFFLAGWEGRTENKAEMAGKGIIGGMWQKVFSENMRDLIPGVLSNEIYAVYSNYESNENGRYDYFIGYKVADLSRLPNGMVGRIIPAGPYKKFETKEGPIHQVVPETWALIWSELKGKRAFKTDYEIYGVKTQNSEKAIVDIYVGLKEAF